MVGVVRCVSCCAVVVALLAACLPVLLSEVASGWTVVARSGFDPTTLPDLTGRVALVTGASTGIGRTTAKYLARAGATVLVHGRSAKRIAPVVEEIQAAGGKALHVLSDHGDLATIPPMAVAVAAMLDGRSLDIVVLNAGLCKDCVGDTDAGFEMTGNDFELHIQVNHLAHQLLVEALLANGALSSSSRLVSVSSALQDKTYAEGMRYEAWREKGLEYTDGKAYGQSKLANIMMASEVYRRFGVQSVSVHPGIIATDLGRFVEAGPRSTGKVIFSILFIAARMTVDQGSFSQLWAATAPNLTQGYFLPVGREAVPHASFNTNSSSECWDRSHELLKQFLA